MAEEKSSGAMQLPNSLFQFIWHFLKPNKQLLWVFFFISIFWSIELSLSPYLLKLIIDGVAEQANHPEQLISHILIPCILYVLMPLLLNINFRVYDYICLLLIPRIFTTITMDVYKYAAQHSYSYFQKNFAGSVSNKILYLPRDIESIIQAINEVFIPRTIAVMVACSMLALASPLFSYVLFVWIVLFIGMSFLLSKRSIHYSNVFAKSVNRIDGKMIDSIANIMTGKLFANVDYENKRIRAAQEDVNLNYKNMQWYNLKFNAIQAISVFFLILAMMILLIRGRMNGTVSIGDFAFVFFLSNAIIMTVWQLGQQMVSFTRNVGKCNEALSLLNVPHDIQNSPNAVPLQITSGSIKFQNVDFSYVTHKNLFQQLSVHIPAGQKVGLVGYSGGGKSSFVNLILRLFDIQAGAIYIDEQNIKNVTMESLRRNITIIPQETQLFHRSVLENIRYGRLEATEDEVIAAAKAAHCHEFIVELEDGYDSLVGERGVKLSGGQRQRIAIARGILKNAPILLLDEATSALDSVTEKYIQESLHHMMQQKTTIVIAHRLSTLLEMDRILLFKDGRIVEDGSLEELRARNGLFAKLWDMQGGGYLPDM